MASIENYPFLTETLFASSLEKTFPAAKIELKSLRVERPLKKGENFSSVILRVVADFLKDASPTTHSFIVKVAISQDGLGELMDDFRIFHREIATYRDVLPKVNDLIGDQLAPRVFAINDRPKHFVFEDLSARGFVKVDPNRGLNFNQAKVALRTIARFHAGTARLFEVEPEALKDFHFRNISPEPTSFHPLFTNSLRACADQAEGWAEVRHLAPKLREAAEHVLPKLFAVYSRDEASFNVCTHGDFWVGNIMFDASMRECILVDFATGFFGSFAIDLAYMLFTSTEEDILDKEFDLLLAEYWTELVGTLRKLDYKGQMPTLLDIQMELLKKGIVGVVFSMIIIPLRVLDDTKNADLGCLLGESEEALEFRKKLFGQKKFQRRMIQLLDYFNRKGYLEK